MVKHQDQYPKNGCIMLETDARMIVNTGLPNANMMHDVSRPFAVCVKIQHSVGRVSCIGRYATLNAAKAALRYRKG
jgi:hypothetical protein